MFNNTCIIIIFYWHFFIQYFKGMSCCLIYYKCIPLLNFIKYNLLSEISCFSFMMGRLSFTRDDPSRLSVLLPPPPKLPFPSNLLYTFSTLVNYLYLPFFCLVFSSLILSLYCNQVKHTAGLCSTLPFVSSCQIEVLD